MVGIYHIISPYNTLFLGQLPTCIKNKFAVQAYVDLDVVPCVSNTISMHTTLVNAIFISNHALRILTKRFIVYFTSNTNTWLGNGNFKKKLTNPILNNIGISGSTLTFRYSISSRIEPR